MTFRSDWKTLRNLESFKSDPLRSFGSTSALKLYAFNPEVSVGDG